MTENRDLRDVFFDEVLRIAQREPNFMLLTDDQGAFGVTEFKNQLPNQYVNTGIAEQNMIGVAAGLALEGKRVLCFGQANFMVYRALEFIRNDLCINNLPVTIAVLGAGWTFSYDGPTHHATEDVAVMNALPNMSIWNPSDAVLTEQVAALSFWTDRPLYIRLERGIVPLLHDHPPGVNFYHGFCVHGNPGAHINLVATGNMVHVANEVARILQQDFGITSRVIDVFELKPLADLREALGNKPTVTLEEHSAIGGLGSMLSRFVETPPIIVIALPDKFYFKYGTREELQWRAGLTAGPLAREIHETLEQRHA